MKHGKKDIRLVMLISDSGKQNFSGENLPTELRVLKFGENNSTKGIIRVGSKTRSLLPLNQRDLGFDRIAIDYEHNTVPGTRAYKESSEPRQVAAHGVPQVRTDGLWLCNIEWTPSGKVNARNYIDLSPAPSLDENGEVVFLHSVALCQQGAVDDLYIFSVDMNNSTSTLETEIMDKLLAALRKAFNLADTADENAIAAALTAPATFSAKLTDLEGKITTLTAAIEKGKTADPAKDGKADDLTAKITTLSTDLAALKTSLTAMQADVEKRDRDALVAQACREGKVIPLSAEDIAKQPVKTLSEMISKLPVMVPVSQRTPENVQQFSVDGAGCLTEADKALARKYGFSEEDVKKANGLK